MRTAVILLIIGVCFQDILCTRRVQRYTSQSGDAIAKKKLQNAQPSISKGTATSDAASQPSSTSQNIALAEIPFLSSEKPTVIEGEKGKISVNGVLLYQDEKFKKGEVRFNSNKSDAYINGNLVAKTSRDDPVELRKAQINYQDADKFEITIHSSGFITSNKNGGSMSMWF